MRSGVKYWHVADAVEDLGKPVGTGEIATWLTQHYPHEDHSDLGANLALLTVNDANRRHYDYARKIWRSDAGHARDRLFRQGRMRATTYEIFRPAQHGHWDLQLNEAGKWEAVAVPSTALSRAEIQAKEQAFDHLPPLGNDHDGRVWTMIAIAQRQGQGRVPCQDPGRLRAALRHFWLLGGGCSGSGAHPAVPGRTHASRGQRLVVALRSPHPVRSGAVLDHGPVHGGRITHIERDRIRGAVWTGLALAGMH